MRIGWLLKRSFLMIGLWDSAIVSLSGFLTNVLTGRYLLPADYGLFITAFTVANMGVVIQSSLISSPYAILAPRLDPKARRDFLAGSTWITLGSSLVAAFLLTGIIYFFFRKSIGGVALVRVLGIFAFYVETVMLQDFVRRVCFTHSQEKLALQLDIFSAGGQVLLLVFLRVHITLNLALFIVSGTTVLGIGVVCMFNLNFYRILLRIENVGQVARQSFALGKWLFVTAGVAWVANQLYLLAVAAFQSPLVVAQLSVARTIAAVSNPAVMTVDNLGMPKASRLVHEHGNAALRSFIIKIAVLGSLPFVLVSMICMAFPDLAVQVLFHRSFGDVSRLVRIFSVMPFMWFAARAIAVGINAMKQPKALFPVYASIACTTLTIGVYLARHFGAFGAALGMLFNSAFMLSGFMVQFLRLTRPAAPPSYGRLP